MNVTGDSPPAREGHYDAYENRYVTHLLAHTVLFNVFKV